MFLQLGLLKNYGTEKTTAVNFYFGSEVCAEV